jgi:hypothetical protein
MRCNESLDWQGPPYCSVRRCRYLATVTADDKPLCERHWRQIDPVNVAFVCIADLRTKTAD